MMWRKTIASSTSRKKQGYGAISRIFSSVARSVLKTLLQLWNFSGKCMIKKARKVGGDVTASGSGIEADDTTQLWLPIQSQTTPMYTKLSMVIGNINWSWVEECCRAVRFHDEEVHERYGHVTLFVYASYLRKAQCRHFLGKKVDDIFSTYAVKVHHCNWNQSAKYCHGTGRFFGNGAAAPR